jgi:hypothetical protein
LSSSTHEPRPRNRGNSKRPTVIARAETRLIASVNDSRAKIGERVTLEARSNGEVYAILPDRMGMIASHGRRVVANELSRLIAGAQTLAFDGNIYLVPVEAWGAVNNLSTKKEL